MTKKQIESLGKISESLASAMERREWGFDVRHAPFQARLLLDGGHLHGGFHDTVTKSEAAAIVTFLNQAPALVALLVEMLEDSECYCLGRGEGNPSTCAYCQAKSRLFGVGGL